MKKTAIKKIVAKQTKMAPKPSPTINKAAKASMKAPAQSNKKTSTRKPASC